MHGLKVRGFEEDLITLLEEHYPEFLKSLFDVHGVAIVRSNGGKVDRLFKPKKKKRADGISRTYVLPNGEIVGVIEE